MNSSAPVSAPATARQGSLAPAEMLVLALLLAVAALGAVFSARLLQKRVLASNAVTATLLIQEHPNNPTPTRAV